jgi:ketosteroid isomerase-like protein
MTSSAEQEIREEFEQWFDEAAAKDTDAVMAHIARDAVSYEHDAPLQYVGVDAIREVCQRGFDAQLDDFRWDIPDLKVIVRDDIAVTWGLNAMRSRDPGGQTMESFSRGTRIFQKIDGEWKMIHQHVSFPYDPETGQAVTDLRP